MEYFIDVSHLDSTTAELLRKYDKDGNGSFSQEEVVEIIMDLRKEMDQNQLLGQTNKLLRKLTIVIIIFCIALIMSTFGLAYAVAILTAKLDVDATTGIMTTPDGSHVVATDSVAYKVSTKKDEITGSQCIDVTELEDMLGRVTNGNIIHLEMIGTGVNGTRTLVEKLTGSVEYGEESLCFMTASGERMCAEPNEACAGGGDDPILVVVDDDEEEEDGGARRRRRLPTAVSGWSFSRGA